MTHLTTDTAGNDRKIYVDHDSGVNIDDFLMYRELMKLAGFHYTYYWANEREIEFAWAKGYDIKYQTFKYTYDGSKVKKEIKTKKDK